MSNTSYTSTRTRAARIAAQDNALAVRAMRTFTYERAELALMAAPQVERDFSLTAWELQQQDWQMMHRGAVASVGQRQYRTVCYPLPVPVKRIVKNHRAEQTVLFI